MSKERFELPTDEQLTQVAIIFTSGKLDKKKLADMLAMSKFVVNRLYDTGTILAPSKMEKEIDSILDQKN